MRQISKKLNRFFQRLSYLTMCVLSRTFIESQCLSFLLYSRGVEHPDLLLKSLQVSHKQVICRIIARLIREC